MLLDQKHLFLDTPKTTMKSWLCKGDVNPYGQPDRKISVFFYDDPKYLSPQNLNLLFVNTTPHTPPPFHSSAPCHYFYLPYHHKFRYLEFWMPFKSQTSLSPTCPCGSQEYPRQQGRGRLRGRRAFPLLRQINMIFVLVVIIEHWSLWSPWSWWSLWSSCSWWS